MPEGDVARDRADQRQHHQRAAVVDGEVDRIERRVAHHHQALLLRPAIDTLEAAIDGVPEGARPLLRRGEIVEAIPGMIATQRAYELNSKAISTSDQMLAKLGQL